MLVRSWPLAAPALVLVALLVADNGWCNGILDCQAFWQVVGALACIYVPMTVICMLGADDDKGRIEAFLWPYTVYLQIRNHYRSA
jgi:hypothetical protein